MGSTQVGLVFAVGLVSGCILSFVVRDYGYLFSAQIHIQQSRYKVPPMSNHVFPMNNESVVEQRHHDPQSHEQVQQEDKEYVKNRGQSQYVDKDLHNHDDDDSVAKDLYSKVRVLVWVMTYPDNLETKARHVNATWGRRANKILYASDTYDPNFPTIPIEIGPGRQHLTAKTMASFDYVYKNYLNDYDWFMKADDDTYVIMENLRYFLSNEDTNEPVFFGHWFKVILNQGFYSGGGGYVLSREALRRFGERSEELCPREQDAEDVALGACMEKLGVHTQDSFDNSGRTRFHCFSPETHLRGNFPDWYYGYDKYGATQVGVTGMSDYPITFHYCSTQVMYDLEYYVYHLRPYGIRSGLQELNTKTPTMPPLDKFNDGAVREPANATLTS